MSRAPEKLLNDSRSIGFFPYPNIGLLHQKNNTKTGLSSFKTRANRVFFATFNDTARELTGPRGVSIFFKRRPGNNQAGYRSSERPENGQAGTPARKHADQRTARAIASTGTNSGEQGNTRRQITRGGVALADQTGTLLKKSFWGVGGRISTGLNPFLNYARLARVAFVPGVLRSA